ncbi:MAG: hypothetical protein ABI181_11625 [Mycobacteriaceae bacterium]
MSSTTGVWQLTRFGLRRDRVLIGAWTLVLVGLCYASAAAVPSLYPTAANRVAAADALNASPAIVALYGPIRDVHSLGELAMTKATVLYAVLLAALVALVVRRHTRGDEEAGRAELLGGTALGRDAMLTAAVAEGVVVSLLVGGLATLADLAAGLAVSGSLAFGASWAGVGMVAAGLTVSLCQLSASARTCAGATAGVLGALYLLRAVGDVSVPWLGWFSPFGWSSRLRAWSDPRWWVLGLYAVATVGLLLVAGALRSRRDLGAGLLAPRPGPPIGSPRLSSALTLALRLHAVALLTWTVATAAAGLVLGAVVPNIGGLLDSAPAREVLGRLGGAGALQETVLAAELSVAAVVVTCFAITVVGRGGADEEDGRTEALLATATSRTRAWVATLVLALAGAVWLMAVAGTGLALGYGAGASRVVAAAMGQVPAVFLVGALVVTAYSVRRGLSAAGWGLLALFVTLGQVGEALRLPRWVVDVSPYAHAPRMPVEPFAIAPAATMTVLGVLVLGCGCTAFRRRDIG